MSSVTANSKPLDRILSAAGLALAKIEAELTIGEVTMCYDRDRDTVEYRWYSPRQWEQRLGAQVFVTAAEFLDEPESAAAMVQREMQRVIASAMRKAAG